MAKYLDPIAKSGEHVVTVETATLKESKAGNQMVALRLSVEGSTQWFRDHFVLSPAAYWKFEQLLAAIGKTPAPDEDINVEDFVGCTARALIGIEEFNDRRQNYVQKWLPPKPANGKGTANDG